MKSIRLVYLARRRELLAQLCSLLLALLCGWALALLPMNGALASTLMALGLDPLRTRLLAALLLTAGAAGLGALLGRRKTGALLGGGGFFAWNYLAGFLRSELQPMRDPLGNLEPLKTGALLHTSLVLLALALLVGFVGAACGRAVSDVLDEPVLSLARLLWRRPRQRAAYAEKRRISGQRLPADTGKSLLTSWLVALLFVLLCLLASDASDLFLYTPDVGLHAAPVLPTRSAVPTQGTLVEASLRSRALGGQRKPFLVYLPPSYNTPQGRLRRYPTLYLLHGSPGTDSDWVTGGKIVEAANTLIALSRIRELIIVLPDGNGRTGQTSEWGNSADGRQKMESYVAHDLVGYVDATYRTLAQSDERGIGGLSMGGFGAMNIAVHHPDIFGFVIALGGYYRAEGSIWGKAPAYLRANSPLDVLPGDRQAWKLHFYLGAATMDRPYYSDTLQFVKELQRLHLPCTLDIQPGYHEWKVWQTQIYHALPWLRWGS